MRKLIIANWKMNLDSVGRAVRLAREIERGLSKMKNSDIIVTPSFPFLLPVGLALKKIKLGAQDVFWEDVGPYTGEVSWRHLKHFGVRYVIVGHSERRALGETDLMVHKKVNAILAHGMKAVLCVGERERKKENPFPDIIQRELQTALRKIKKSLLKNLIVAYEPIWAISTSKKSIADTPKNVFEMSAQIRRYLQRILGKKTAPLIPILYGGSVNKKNALEFIREGRVEGLLVGGASLNAKEFIGIVREVEQL